MKSDHRKNSKEHGSHLTPGAEAKQKTVDYACHRFEGTRAKFTHMTLAASYPQAVYK